LFGCGLGRSTSPHCYLRNSRIFGKTFSAAELGQDQQDDYPLTEFTEPTEYQRNPPHPVFPSPRLRASAVNSVLVAAGAARVLAVKRIAFGLFTSTVSRYVPSVNLEANLRRIRERIAAACARAGRDPASVTLLAVAKGQPPERVAEAAQLGLTLFGENKVQEARAKIPLCPGRLRWHMIGHLQSNKCRDAVELFDTIQSVDSLRLAEEIHKRADQAAKSLPMFLEVNVIGEASKFGYRPESLLPDLPQLARLPRLELQGLMTVAPWTPEPEKVRPVFRQLRELKERCEQILGVPLPHLSMGMSGDCEVAIEEGATLVRIGTALFGERQYPVNQPPGRRP
jgi:pyridoxal phosphate enzyme (YggS family)